MLFLTTYVKELLEYSYNIQDNRRVFVPRKINSVNPGWSLSFLLQ